MPLTINGSLKTQAQAAFRAAMPKVLQRARQAGHGILIWRDERVTEISCDEAEQLLKNAEIQANSLQPGRTASD